MLLATVVSDTVEASHGLRPMKFGKGGYLLLIGQCEGRAGNHQRLVGRYHPH
jgi:hypothetical protein